MYFLLNGDVVMAERVNMSTHALQPNATALQNYVQMLMTDDNHC